MLEFFSKSPATLHVFTPVRILCPDITRASLKCQVRRTVRVEHDLFLPSRSRCSPELSGLMVFNVSGCMASHYGSKLRDQSPPLFLAANAGEMRDCLVRDLNQDRLPSEVAAQEARRERWQQRCAGRQQIADIYLAPIRAVQHTFAARCGLRSVLGVVTGCLMGVVGIVTSPVILIALLMIEAVAQMRGHKAYREMEKALASNWEHDKAILSGISLGIDARQPNNQDRLREAVSHFILRNHGASDALSLLCDELQSLVLDASQAASSNGFHRRLFQSGKFPRGLSVAFVTADEGQSRHTTTITEITEDK